MIDADRYAESLLLTLTMVHTRGHVTWERVNDWASTKGMPSQWTPGEDEDDEIAREGRSEIDDDERRGDAAASRYNAEVSAILNRTTADLARLRRIITVCNPDSPKHLANRDMLLAQVAAEGLCVNCWLDDQYLQEIQLQPSGVPFYKNLCRGCGEWKAAHGKVPPLSILVLRHAGRRVTTADAAKALGRPA